MIKFPVLSLVLLLCILISGVRTGFPQHSWEYYCDKGMIEYRAEMYEYSIFNMERCLEENPRSFMAANILAEIYNKKEKKFKAVEYYKLSLHINDNQPDIHCIIGELYELFGEMDLAFKHFIRATEIDHNHVRAHCNLVRHFIKKNDRASAELHFRISQTQAMRISGKIVQEAADAEMSGRLKRAIILYNRVIEEGPSILEAYTGLYEIHRRMSNYRAAAAALERLKFVRPDYEKAYVLLGSLYFTQKLPGNRKAYLDRAIDNLQKAIELNPDNYETYYTLSEVYRFIRKDVEARDYEDKAREIEKRSEGKN